MKFLLVMVTVLALAAGMSISFEEDVEEIVLKQGVVRGTRQRARNSRILYSFRGIPFAQPPTGPLRFKDPVPVGDSAPQKSDFLFPKCPQINFESLYSGKGLEVDGEEDCLYLNVHVPQTESSRLLPVMVYIHGGGYEFGDAESFGGNPDLLLTEDVVLVSIQYRIGLLGFVSTEDEVLPGNLGLKDQILALKWVQENIKRFHGDPNQVTIFGVSAGAGSAHQQVLSPKSKGLFNRAILQSGTALDPWAIRKDHKIMASKIGHDLECPGFDPESPDSVILHDCLHSAPLDRLVTATMKYKSPTGMSFHMVPRVDGDVLPDHPARLLKEGRYNRVSLISGVCQNEGAYTAITQFMQNPVLQLAENFDPLMAESLYVQSEENADYLSKRIFYKYLNSTNITYDNADAYEEMYGDALFTIGHDLTSQLHARDEVFGENVFRYQLDHRGSFSLGDIVSNVSIGEEWINHGDDIQYLFNHSSMVPALHRHEDIFLSEVMVKLWTNFAKTGNPTPDLSLGFVWEPVKGNSLDYLSLKPSPEMHKDNRAEIREFWTNLPIETNKNVFPEKFAKNHNEDL